MTREPSRRPALAGGRTAGVLDRDDAGTATGAAPIAEGPLDATRAGHGRPAPRVILAVNARVRDAALHGGGSDGPQRRTDFGSLAAAFGADTVDWDTADGTRIWRLMRRKLGFGPVAALLVFLRRRRYDVFWCFTEVEGLLLALLFKLFRVHKILFITGNQTLSPKALFLLRRLKVWTHVTALLPINCYQADELRRLARIPEDKVVVMPYQVDCDYFSGRPGDGSADGTGSYIVAVGLEGRDYPALVGAVRGLDVEVKVAAASLWSGQEDGLPAALPANVTVGAYTYAELRRLYAGAALAVVPLRETPYQHGVTALLEAMAMGLPVIVTRTSGMGDVVIDRRKVLGSNPALPTQGGFARMLAPGRPDLARPNGLYVGAGDVAALRRSICYLLRERELAAGLGAQAQRLTRELLSLDAYTQRAQRLVTAAWRGAALDAQTLLPGPAGRDHEL